MLFNFTLPNQPDAGTRTKTSSTAGASAATQGRRWGSEDDTYKFNGERRQINEQQSNTRKTERPLKATKWMEEGKERRMKR